VGRAVGNSTRLDHTEAATDIPRETPLGERRYPLYFLTPRGAGDGELAKARMPTISWFYGNSIRMYFNDHAPPHFHAIIGGDDG